MEKIYRFAHAETAIELLRPAAAYTAQGKYTMQDFAILEWDDERPQPEVEEIEALVAALRIAEDLAEPVYTAAQIETMRQIAAETNDPLLTEQLKALDGEDGL